jgi:type I restriction enzyme R subunit
MPTPEDKARENIDRLLTKAGWTVRDQSDANILAYRDLAIRNFASKQCHGSTDHLPYVDGRASGVVATKKEGVTLTDIETRSDRRKKSKFDSRNSTTQ